MDSRFYRNLYSSICECLPIVMLRNKLTRQQWPLIVPLVCYALNNVVSLIMGVPNCTRYWVASLAPSSVPLSKKDLDTLVTELQKSLQTIGLAVKSCYLLRKISFHFGEIFDRKGFMPDSNFMPVCIICVKFIYFANEF